jgi:hypothetical protein
MSSCIGALISYHPQQSISTQPDPSSQVAHLPHHLARKRVAGRCYSQECQAAQSTITRTGAGTHVVQVQAGMKEVQGLQNNVLHHC